MFCQVLRRCCDSSVLRQPQVEWWWLFKFPAADVAASKSVAAWQWSNYIIPTFSPLITTLQKTKFCNVLDFCYSLQTPMFFLWSSNKSFPNGFVNKSANRFLDVQNSTLISLLFISSWIKWYCVSICLLLLWKTWFLDSAIAELLS